MQKFRPLACQTLVAMAMALPGLAMAQSAANYPTRPITAIIPFASGGSTDNEARLYTDKVSRGLGQTIVFDYRPGAASSIGVNHALKSAPDGYTILITNAGLTVFPHFYPKLGPDVIRTLIPISELSRRTTAMLVSVKALPNIHNVKALIAYAKSRSEPLFCNTAGAGGITHTVCAAMSLQMGIDVVPVHYKGVALGQADLMAGRTQISGGTLFQAMPNIRSGKLRAIAVMGQKRSSLMPELPSSYEQGVKVDYPSWLGVFAPPGTAAPIVAKLGAEFIKAVRSPDVIQRLEKQGSTPIGNSPAEFKKTMDDELAYWGDVIKKANVKLK